MDAQQTLAKYWGFKEFRPLQEEIINAVVAGQDALAVLPTSGGKSICYQVPGMMQEGVCVVVSPLIALMRDQVSRLTKMGIKAVALTAGISFRELDIVLDNCIYGHTKFLYLSPERLTTDIVRERLKKIKVNLLAVDEAHCISQWGYDFRPAYMQIVEVRELLPDTPMLALTASATELVKHDIIDKLSLTTEQVFQASFERKNLAYVVRHDESKLNKLEQILTRVKGSAIVYVRNRKKTRNISEYLSRKGFSADYYHAGLDITLRYAKQEQWLENKIRVMVCTNAFGMGIDKPDVRLVVHVDLPENIESYYQEAGRAGRDGKRAFAALLYNLSDKLEVERRIKNQFPAFDEVVHVYSALSSSYALAIGSGEGVSFDFEIVAFCNTFSLDIIKTMHALKLLQQQGLISLSESVFLPSRVKIKVGKEGLYKFQIENRKFDPLIKHLLRSYSGLFEEFVVINEWYIAKALNLSKPDVMQQLHYLDRTEVIDFEPQSECPKITYLLPRQDTKYLPMDKKFIEERMQLYQRNLKAILGFATNRSTCRSRYILNYFGESDNYRCGICDICIERNKLGLSDMDYDHVIKEIKEHIQRGDTHVKQLVNGITQYNEKRVLGALKWLMDSGQVIQLDDDQLVWSE